MLSIVVQACLVDELTDEGSEDAVQPLQLLLSATKSGGRLETMSGGSGVAAAEAKDAVWLANGRVGCSYPNCEGINS